MNTNVPRTDQDTTLPPFHRFWSKVNKDGPVIRPDLGPCWVWTASRDAKGYGRLWAGDGKYALAHRFSWGLAGYDAGEFCVLHQCDNPPCVRPDHLFLGTVPVNNADMVAKGRIQKGESHYRALLTVNAAQEIRRKYRRGSYGYDRLARDFGVSRSTIRNVIAGTSWRQGDSNV